MSFMVSVTNNPFMLSVVILNVVMLSVVAPDVDAVAELAMTENLIFYYFILF
jgi:hypothetical protein